MISVKLESPAMVVRIRLNYSGIVRPSAHSNRHAAAVMASLLTPVALMAWVLGGWRLLADIGITGTFAISTGLFSHWQVWIALGIGVQFAGFLLQRFSRSEDLDSLS